MADARAEHGRHAVGSLRTARDGVDLVGRVLGAALAQRHGDEFVALEDGFAHELRLVFPRRYLGAETRGLALMGHDDAGHGVHVVLQGDISPDGAPQSRAGHRNDHPAVLGLENREAALIERALQVVEHGEDIAALDRVAVGIQHAGCDEFVVVFVRSRKRRQDRLLLLAQFVGILPLLQRECGHGQHQRHDDDHHRRVDDDIEVTVRIDFFHDCILPYLAGLTRLFLRRMLASTT